MCNKCRCDDGYILPPLHVHWHKLDTDHTKAWGQVDSWGQAQLLRDDAQGLKESAEMKRESIEARVAKAKEIMEFARFEAGSEWSWGFQVPAGLYGYIDSGFSPVRVLGAGTKPGAIEVEHTTRESDRSNRYNAYPSELRPIPNSPEKPEKHWLIWHDLEAEREAIERVIPEAVTVYGSQDLDLREDRIVGFSRGEYRILATKPVIAGSGCNFQRHCADAIFLGVGYKFNDFIQAIHRVHRFQQSREVHIHIIYLESESAIRDALLEKWRRHDELMARMGALLREHKLSNTNTMELIRTLGCEREEVRSERFSVIHNDCVLELQQHPENSVDMVCTSIPFGNQYEYSPSFNDFGHNTGDDPFFEQMDFLVPELLRVLRPGRIAAIHVKDRILFGNVTGKGTPTVNRFSDKTADCFERHGFAFMARITIDTDVVRENNQTYRLGWSENAKDSSKMGAGMPEYVLVFRKLPTDLSRSYADVPVTKDKAEYTRADWQIDAAGFWRSSGNRLPDPEVLRCMPLEDIKRLWSRFCLSGGYSHEQHVELAKALEEIGKLPSSFMLFPPISRNADVWTDIARMRTLNTEQSRRNVEKHVCPLQLDIIERLITRYTNRGDVILDPFDGIGSVAYQAIKMGRKAIGIELNPEYWRFSVGYCEMAEAEMTAPTLFDLAPVMAAVA